MSSATLGASLRSKRRCKLGRDRRWRRRSRERRHAGARTSLSRSAKSFASFARSSASRDSLCFKLRSCFSRSSLAKLASPSATKQKTPRTESDARGKPLTSDVCSRSIELDECVRAVNVSSLQKLFQVHDFLSDCRIYLDSWPVSPALGAIPGAPQGFPADQLTFPSPAGGNLSPLPVGRAVPVSPGRKPPPHQTDRRV